MDSEFRTDYLGEGICRKCNSHVVFAFARHIDSGVENRVCLNCGQVYQRDNKWEEKTDV